MRVWRNQSAVLMPAWKFDMSKLFHAVLPKDGGRSFLDFTQLNASVQLHCPLLLRRVTGALMPRNLESYILEYQQHFPQDRILKLDIQKKASYNQNSNVM